MIIWRKKQIAGWWKILYNQIIFGEWEIVVESYRNNYNLFRNHKLNKLGETALHLAVSHGPENIVEDHVQIISQQGSIKEVLRITNNQGNNPLHLAAATGSLRKCICLAEAHPSLGNERNQMGESPLFLAALHGKTDIFLCLHHICSKHLDDSYNPTTGEMVERLFYTVPSRGSVGLSIFAESFHFITLLSYLRTNV